MQPGGTLLVEGIADPEPTGRSPRIFPAWSPTSFVATSSKEPYRSTIPFGTVYPD
jgi:hypothetical protein